MTCRHGESPQTYLSPLGRKSVLLIRGYRYHLRRVARKWGSGKTVEQGRVMSGQERGKSRERNQASGSLVDVVNGVR